MSSRHLVDPAVTSILDLTALFQLTPETLPAMRAQLLALIDATPAPPTSVKAVARTIPGPKGAPDVPVLIYSTGKKSAPAILHIHGGGFVMGSAKMADPDNALLAEALGAVIVSVDYRLAPETPFPGPVEDCYAALCWLHDNAAELGVDASRIAISGESAGGGLAAATALLARDRGGPKLVLQRLIYPMLDDRTAASPPASPCFGEFIWTRASNVFGWRSLLAAEPGGADVSPYAAPARAKDVAGLPPTYLACGALDLFLEEDLDYARRLMAAGVPTEMHIYPGAPHGFMMAADAEISQAFARDSLAALKRALK